MASDRDHTSFLDERGHHTLTGHRHESNPGRDNVLSFEDKGRKGGVIEMFDDTRAMWIRIDLNTRRIFWSTNGKKSWNYIYNITSAK